MSGEASVQPSYVPPPGDAERPEVRVQVLSQPRYLAGVREMMTALAHRLGLDEAGASQVALAVDEALCNVIRHGYEQRGDGSIEVCVWPMSGEDAGGSGDDPGAVGGGLYIRIEDRGRQTEPDHIRSRELTEIRPGGLGVHIIKEVMDYVRYDKREGGGMRLTMMKRAGGSGGGGDAASVSRAGRACDSATGAE